MKKSILVMLFVTLTVLAIAGNASAAVPGEFTLSLNGGYPITLGELELEYKNGPWAGGMHTTFVGPGIEMGMFGRYYVPLGAGFNFYAAVNPSMIVMFTPEVRGLIKVGPGFDFRWKHLRVGIEGGLLVFFGGKLFFYTKLGLGVRF